MARKKSHGISKKLVVNITALFFIIIICYVGGTNSFIQNKVASIFDNTANSQKLEYQKQQRIAQKKYGKSDGSQKKLIESSSAETIASTESSSTSTKKISETKASLTSTSSSIAYKSYVVESGDTLSSIANKFNTTVTKIMNVNNLSTGTINARSTLRVPNGTLSTINSK